VYIPIRFRFDSALARYIKRKLLLIIDV